MDSNAVNIIEKLLENDKGTKSNANDLKDVCNKFTETMDFVTSTLTSPKLSSKATIDKKFDLISYHGDIEIENIDSKSYMNNVKVKLRDSTHFISWYQSFYVQSSIYNVKIRASCDIDKDKLSGEKSFRPGVKDYTGQLLLNKLNSGDVIDTKFKEAFDTLSFCRNGFDFLDVFLQRYHLRLSTIPIIALEIPKYSNTQDLYLYCKEVDDYYYRHQLNGNKFKCNKMTKTESFFIILTMMLLPTSKQIYLENLNFINRFPLPMIHHPNMLYEIFQLLFYQCKRSKI